MHYSRVMVPITCLAALIGGPVATTLTMVLTDVVVQTNIPKFFALLFVASGVFALWCIVYLVPIRSKVWLLEVGSGKIWLTASAGVGFALSIGSLIAFGDQFPYGVGNAFIQAMLFLLSWLSFTLWVLAEE